ncbi:hypothetical protein EDEG_01110 [Edhazardia aedis USNM 41457]|uniref:t-SNARE coiled-coil homology domain-containing protein n=1 Tax=Edhazardia aedis (strain USNM 41457) TaxID=1003232 RepID=J9DTS3_EDHAE|nr:hypothetical protein EDEG_01110 [Edhazardia aedis USNM 41457]|eukprot:EJW04697.1 hypothetical protein EDEG_01110 [Edhazardia aedis USNM 41457]
MDRTREYKTIIQSANTYQIKPKNCKTADKFVQTEADIQNLKKEISEEPFEKHKIQLKFDKIEQFLDQKISTSASNETVSLQDKLVKDIILEIETTKKRCLSLMFQKTIDMFTNKLKQNAQKYKPQKKNTNTINCKNLQLGFTENIDSHTNNLYAQSGNDFLDQAYIEENQVKQRSELELKKEKIQNQINELGQIVCDISLHIQAQGESLKRIDDMVDGSNAYLKRNLFETKRFDQFVKSRRGVILKFFLFCLLLLFVYYIKHRK